MERTIPSQPVTPHAPTSHPVTSKAGVRVLFDAVHRHRLALLVRQASTIADVARWMNEDLRRSHHAVRRYCTLGLVHEIARRQRRGRPQRLYRTVAEKFFVGPADMPIDPVESAEQLALPVARAIIRDGLAHADRAFDQPRGRSFELSSTGDTLHPVAAFHPGEGLPDLIDRFASESIPAVWFSAHQVSLTRAEAKRIQRALIALVRDIEAERPPTMVAQRHRMLLMMAPRDDTLEPD